MDNLLFKGVCTSLRTAHRLNHFCPVLRLSRGFGILDFGLPLGYLLAFVWDMGAAGMWIGLISGLTFASGFLIRRFLRRSRIQLQSGESQ